MLSNTMRAAQRRPMKPVFHWLLGALMAAVCSAASLAEVSEEMLVGSSAVAIDVIVGIDRDTRAVTLRSEESGEEFTFIAGPEVRNFDQLQRGDLVLTEYYEAFGVAIGPAVPAGFEGDAASCCRLYRG